MSDYSHLFANPKGPGDARPTALQIVEDNNLIGKLSANVALVTGVVRNPSIQRLFGLVSRMGT